MSSKNRFVRSFAAVGLVGGAAFLAASCNSTVATPNLTPADVVGTYTLISLTFPPAPAMLPPAETGTLVLRMSPERYVVTLLGALAQTDSGSYTITGGTWTQNSEVLPVQSVGSAGLNNGVLSVSVTTAGNVSQSTWQKQ